jgi:hypothetical protein
MGVLYVSIEEALPWRRCPGGAALEALPWADVVSVHVPLLKSTHHFINGDRCGTPLHVLPILRVPDLLNDCHRLLIIMIPIKPQHPAIASLP